MKKVLILLADSLCYKVLVAGRGPATSEAPAEPTAEPQTQGAHGARHMDHILPEAPRREGPNIWSSVKQAGRVYLRTESPS